MQEVARVINLVAMRRCTVLISGETGTGKEMCARAIHAASDRAHKPMVALNCSAIPEHLLEAEALRTHPGRIHRRHQGPRRDVLKGGGRNQFLDEIGEVPIESAGETAAGAPGKKFQRVGKTPRTIRSDVRIIAATNRRSLKAVKPPQGGSARTFITGSMSCRSGCPRSANGRATSRCCADFVTKICAFEGMESKEIYNETLARLAACEWPGNVRQLENMVERAVVISGIRNFLVPSDFPLSPPERCGPAASPLRTDHFAVPDHGIDFTQVVTVFERKLLDQALEKAKGNKSRAGLLRMKRSTLISKLRAMEQFAAAAAA